MYTRPSLLCKYCQANFACQGGTHATPRGDTSGETMDDVQNSFHNPGASNSSTSFAALHHFGIPLTGEVGLYSLCWSQSWNRSKDQSKVFLVFAWNLALSGPLLQNGGAHLRCCVGELCRVDIRGNNLSHQNHISVHRHTCSSSSRIKLPGILGSGSPTRSNLSQYELGILASGHIEASAICCRPRKESLGVLYGYLRIFGPL